MISQKQYRIPIPIVPEELVGATEVCPHCERQPEIPWLTELPFPKQSVEPDDGDGSGYWVPMSFDYKCNYCTTNIRVHVPPKNTESIWTSYGDEAERIIKSDNNIDDRFFFCITLVTLHKKRHQRIERQILNLKKSIRSNIDPQSWQLHFTKILNDGHSAEKIYSLPTFDSKVEFAKKYARIIRNAHPYLRALNFSGTVSLTGTKNEKAEIIKQHKRDVFCLSLISSLQQFRKREKGIRWVFDNIKDTSNGPRTEGWAEQVFLGLQHIPLFTYLGAGSTVLKPTFVEPGTHYLLEIADFISYCVGRDYEKTANGEKSLFPSSLLGNNFYQSFQADGSVDYKWSRGLPL